ncbi:abhydrolase domain containing 12B-like protein [Camelus ferus]|nr:abhydrolase domain containing 12B-like protein [Camelus ferus]
MEADEQGCVAAWWDMVVRNLRAAPHRLRLVKVLSDGGFHVLSVDYRGFGDSTGKPTEEGLIADTVCVYEWTKARSGTTPVCFWGHSLGTAVKFLSSPLLILHGEDDKTVPVEFGRKLYEIAHSAYRNKERVRMVIFPPGFQHNFLCKCPMLLKTRFPEPAVGMRSESSGE